jgi:Zn finger protein HypA/HybF involved in hydrogenase expression
MATKVFAAGVLAGRYIGKDITERPLLNHAVSDTEVSEGRLKREPGEAFCSKKIELVDSVVWEDADQISCPKCKDIVARIMAKQRAQ